MLQKSQAQQQAAEAIKFRSTNRQMMRDEFLRASESFLQCEMYDEAAICLNNAREWTLLAKLYKKKGKVSMEWCAYADFVARRYAFVYFAYLNTSTLGAAWKCICRKYI